MNISEKLDFLMNVTNTRNSALGKALSFDPSYISRIRSGSRGIPKSQPFSRPVAAYFSRNIKDKYQLETVSKMIKGDGTLPLDEDEFEELIFGWLQDDIRDNSSDGPMSGIIDDISKVFKTYDNAGPETDIPISFEKSIPKAEDRVVPVGVFYGNQGKRDCVKRFFTSLLAQKKPFQLYFASDEDMSWLYENPAFTKEWTGLLKNLIKSGSHLQVIHTAGREFSEMMESIRRWLPLYAMGSIEPYYCPKLRDKIYRRSLFIAKGFSAVVSTSVENKTDGMANLLVRNPEVVDALELEYHNYLSLCRPLMKSYMAKDRDRFSEVLLGEMNSGGKIFISGPAPSLWTMPKDVAASIARRAGDNELIRISEALGKKMRKHLQSGGEITEITALHGKEKIGKNGLAVPLSDMYGSAEYRYTEAEYIKHIKHAMELSKEFEGYRIIESGAISASTIMMVQLDADTLVAGTEAPTTVFHISNQQFSYAFFEYLSRMEKDSTYRGDKMLSHYISEAEN